MPTGQSKVNIYEKRLLERTAIKDNFLDFLVDSIDEITAAMFQGQAGVLDQDEIEITSTLADTFTLDLTNASKCIVGTGQIIDLTRRPSSLYTQVPFENLTGNTYSVGIKFAEVESGIESNPRSGDPEYPRLLQTYGELDTPDLVTDFTTYIRIRINSITGANEDHTGRTVRVWLVDPVSGVESIAYFSGTSAYSSPNNYVDIPYTSPDGPLGQDTGAGPPSTTTSDYLVFIEGPSWRNKANKDLSTDTDYAFIGEITGLTGSIPVGFDISGQIPVFLITLDRAYDGPVGSGSGRLIFVDNEAVEMRSRSGTTDEMGATLRIDRKGGTEVGGSCLQTIADEQTDGGEACVVHMIPITHAGGGMGINIPSDSTAATVITRSAAENFITSNVNPRCDLAWLQGFSTIDGLYQVFTVTASTVTLLNLDGTAPTFPIGDGPGNMTFLRAVQTVSPVKWGGITNPLAHGRGGTGFVGTNEGLGLPTGDGGDDALSAVSMYSDKVDNLHVREAYPAAPLVVLWINTEGVLQTINPLTLSPARDSQLGATGAQGLQLKAIPPNSLTPPDLFFGGTGDAMVIQEDHNSDKVRLIEPCGFDSEPHVFKDNFFYDDSAWVAKAPSEYSISTSGSAFVQQASSTAAPTGMAHGGAVRLGNTALVESAQLRGPISFWLDTAKMFLLFKARFAVDDAILGDRILRVGLYDPVGGNYYIRFELDANLHINQNYWLVVDDGVNLQEKVDTGFGPQFSAGNPLYSNFYFAITGHQTIRYWTSQMAVPATLTLSTITFNGAGVLMRPQAHHESLDPTVANSWLDYWEARDNEVVGATYGKQVY